MWPMRPEPLASPAPDTGHGSKHILGRSERGQGGSARSRTWGHGPHHGKAGCVNFQGVLDFCERSVADGAALWHLQSESLPRSPTFAAFLTLLASIEALRSLFAQLAIFLATRWEKVLQEEVVGHGATEVSVSEQNNAMASQYRMHLSLAKHLNATQVYCSDRSPLRCVSICTDKSSVGGLPLHNTFVQVNGQPAVMFALSQAAAEGGEAPRGGSLVAPMSKPGPRYRTDFRPIR